jgi:hypothetical protein
VMGGFECCVVVVVDLRPMTLCSSFSNKSDKKAILTTVKAVHLK